MAQQLSRIIRKISSYQRIHLYLSKTVYRSSILTTLLIKESALHKQSQNHSKLIARKMIAMQIRIRRISIEFKLQTTQVLQQQLTYRRSTIYSRQLSLLTLSLILHLYLLQLLNNNK